MAIIQNNYSNSTRNTCDYNTWTTTTSPYTTLRDSMSTIGVAADITSVNLNKLAESVEELKNNLKKEKPKYDIKITKDLLPDEIIVINFKEDIDLDTAKAIVEDLEKRFPYNQIVAKFNFYDLYRTPCIEVL